MKDIVKGVSCFSAHKKCNIECDNKVCRLWIDKSESLNCTLIESARGPKTLQEVGEIFNITRMRVCQIEKKILSKLKDLQDLSFNNLN
jgi:hypothetical protein